MTLEALADQLVAYAEASARKTALPAFPEALRDVWTDFNRLSGRRQVGMAPNPLSFAEIDAYRRLTHARIGPWEVELICRLDDVVLAVAAEKSQGGAGNRQEVASFAANDTAGLKAWALEKAAAVAANRKGR